VIINRQLITMPDLSIENESEGRILGLILQWRCGHCEKENFNPLLRNEAATGKKDSRCPVCNNFCNITFSPSKTISEREKFVQRSLSCIPPDKQQQILEDLAWVESLFVIGGSEDIAKSYWENLQKEIDFWIERDRDKLTDGMDSSKFR